MLYISGALEPYLKLLSGGIWGPFIATSVCSKRACLSLVAVGCVTLSPPARYRLIFAYRNINVCITQAHTALLVDACTIAATAGGGPRNRMHTPVKRLFTCKQKPLLLLLLSLRVCMYVSRKPAGLVEKHWNGRNTFLELYWVFYFLKIVELVHFCVVLTWYYLSYFYCGSSLKELNSFGNIIKILNASFNVKYDL